MSDAAPTILLTRPQAQSWRFAKGLGDAKVVISPVIEVQNKAVQADPRAYDGLIFTSENGVRAAAAAFDLNGLHGYAVGQRTATAGEAAGLKLRSANGSADDLVAMIIRDQPPGRLLHLHGTHSRGDVARRLQIAGIETDSVVIYDQIARPLSTEALSLLSKEVVVLLPLFSPRTASLLGPMCQKARADLILIGMSQAVLDAWVGPKPLQVQALSAPSADAMRQELLRQTGQVA